MPTEVISSNSMFGSKKKEIKFQKQTVIFDKWLLITALILTVFGVAMVYDASIVTAFRDFGDKYWFLKNQGRWAIAGLAALTATSFIDYHFWRKIAPLAWIGAFILMLAVFIPALNYQAYGAHRWLNFGFIKLQPAELIKVTTVLYLAALFEKKIKTVPFLLILGAVIIVTGILQKDLGTTIIFSLTSLAVYFIAGAPIINFLAILPPIFLGGVLLIWKFPYRLKRLTSFWDPASDPQGASYHIHQILLALGSGGLFGVGLGASRQKFEYLPEVTTDSIFAVIGEELGFVGALVLIAVFSFLIWRAAKIAFSAPDRFGQLLAFGIVFSIAIQVLINLAAMAALIPLTGVPLPFISYGGSALVVVLGSIGILLNISKQSVERK